MQRNRCLLMLALLTLIAAAAGPVPAAERFTDNGDGTVTDHRLGLMWSKSDNNGDVTWHQARRWVRLTFPYTIEKQYGNWRLPTLAELQSLAGAAADDGYETDCGQRVHLVAPIELSCGWVWSSETDPRAPTAVVFNFDNVYHYKVRQAHRRGYRALAVRDFR